MSGRNINVLVPKLLEEWGFALFSKKATILPNNKVPEYLKNNLLNDSRAILTWNLFRPDELNLVLHVDWMQGNYFRVISPHQEKILYTEKSSITELRNKIAQILCLTAL